MANKCVSSEAKSFENKLNELGITYNQFKSIEKLYSELSIGGKAEVADMLKTYDEED